MTWLVDNMYWVMLISGILTCTMFYGAIAPRAALLSMFGASLEGPLAEVIVRNWAALITLSGAMLIYGAYAVEARPLVLIVVGTSKLIFISLVLSQFGEFGRRQAGIAAAIDMVMVALFAAYLAATL